jgi:hypothetical protein
LRDTAECIRTNGDTAAERLHGTSHVPLSLQRDAEIDRRFGKVGRAARAA